MRRYLSKLFNGIKPSSLAAVLAVWVIVLLYMLFQGGKTSAMLFSMVSLLGIYLIGSSFGGVNRVKAVRSVITGGRKQDALHAGEQVKIKMDIAIPGLLPMPYLIVREVLRRHNGDTWSFEESVIPSLRGTGELVFHTPPLERGRYAFAKTECASKDIFGLLEHRGTIEVRTEFRVLPRVVHIPGWQRNLRSIKLGGTQTSLSTSRRETTQINGVRDYVYGDRISRIHWNATAKTGTWKSKEFEHESFPKTMVVLDCTDSGYRRPAQFELAVSAAASLVEYGAREHSGVGLYTAAKNPRLFAPSDAPGERMRMIQHLVDVDADRTESLLRSLEHTARHFPKGALFLLVSPCADQTVVETFRWAESRGMTPCLLHISGSQTGKPGGQEYADFLKARGIMHYAASSLEELPALLGGMAG